MVCHVLLTKMHIQSIILMRVGDLEVETKPAVKHLEIMIERTNKNELWKQNRRTTDQSAREVPCHALARIVGNVTGPRLSKCRLLIPSINSFLLDGAEGSAPAFKKSCTSPAVRCTVGYLDIG